jgi:O-antigen/teichoic acid export membrane protein
MLKKALLKKGIVNKLLDDPQTRTSIFLFGQKMVVAFLGYLFWIIAARLFPSEQIGLATAIVAALWMVVVLSMLGFGETLVRFLPTSLDKSTLVSTVLWIVAGASIVLSILFVWSLNFWNESLAVLKDNPAYTLSFVVLAVLWTVMTIYEYLFLSIEKTQYALLQTFLWAVTKLLFLVGFYFLIVTGYKVIFFSWLFSGFLTFLVVYRFYLKPNFSLSFVFRASSVLPYMKFSLMNCMTLFLTFALQMVMPLLIISKLGKASSAYFYFDWSIAFLFCTVANAISSAMLARVSNSKEDIKKALKKAMSFFGVLVFIPAIFLFIFAEKILVIFGPEYAQNASVLLRYLAIGTVLYTLFSLYKYWQLVLKRADRTLLVEAFVTISTILFSFLLMEKYGINIIGIVWIIALFPLSIFSLYLLIKFLIFDRPIKQ